MVNFTVMYIDSEIISKLKILPSLIVHSLVPRLESYRTYCISFYIGTEATEAYSLNYKARYDSERPLVSSERILRIFRK